MANIFSKLRIAFALWRIRRQIKKRLKEARQEGRPVNIASLIEYVLKMKFLAKYRTKIGAAALLVGGVLATMASPEFLEAFPLNMPEWLIGVGTYLGVIGARYKDDSS